MHLNGHLTIDDRAARYTVDLPATLRGEDATPIDVSIENLSSTGFLMHADVALQIGDAVTVGIPGLGRQPAVVVRRTETGYGCRMLTPVDERLVASAELVATFTVADFPGGDAQRDLIGEEPYPLHLRLRIIAAAIASAWAAFIGVMWAMLG